MANNPFLFRLSLSHFLSSLLKLGSKYRYLGSLNLEKKWHFVCCGPDEYCLNARKIQRNPVGDFALKLLTQ